MLIFKHMYFSLKYNKSYWLVQLICLLLFLVLLFSLCDSRNSFRQEIEKNRAHYAKQVKILPKSAETAPLTLEQLEGYSTSDLVATSTYEGYLYFSSAVESAEQQATNTDATAIAAMDMTVASVLPMEELNKKLGQLTISEQQVGCWLYHDYAQAHQLSSGDTFSCYNNQLPVSLYVAGIYETTDSQLTKDMYVSSEYLQANHPELFSKTQWEMTYYLKNRTDFTAFSKQLAADGLDKQYELVSNEGLSDEATIYLQEAAKKSQYWLIGLAVVGAGPLGGGMLLLKKRRLSEIGFLASIGIRKRKIVGLQLGNYFLFLLGTSFLAFLLAKHLLPFLAQQLIDSSLASFTLQTIKVVSNLNLPLASEVQEPLTTATLTTAISLEKIGIVVGLLLIFLVGRINEMRRFHFSQQLLEEEK